MAVYAEPDAAGMAAVLEGHRRLLATFRDFDLASRDGGDTVPDLFELRAAVAFLRQAVLPFSRWEEGILAPDREGRDAAAFEHAFLAVEIDALAVEVANLGAEARSGRRPGRHAVRRLDRRIHRIEAMLEFHTLRVEDRGILVPGRPVRRPGGG